jgi:uncharacterized protein
VTEVDKHEPGTISWIDVQTTDPEAGKRFYSQLFGWDYEDMPFEGGVYTMFRLRGRDVAALSQMWGPEGVPPHWNTYVTVEDVDGCAKTAADLGGNVLMEPFDVLDAGRQAVIQDPTGVVINLWEPRNNIGAQILDEPGALTWAECLTRDTEGAKRFYSELLGWTPEKSDLVDAESGGEPYTLFKKGEQTVGGLSKITDDLGDMPPNWSICFAVEDAEATARKAQELGGSILMPPTEMPSIGKFASVADPQGAVFAILQPAASA